MITNKELIKTFITYLFNMSYLKNMLTETLKLKQEIGNKSLREEIELLNVSMKEFYEYINIKAESIYYELKKRKITDKEIEKMNI